MSPATEIDFIPAGYIEVHHRTGLVLVSIANIDFIRSSTGSTLIYMRGRVDPIQCPETYDVIRAKLSEDAE
ncbi:MAG TPA: hypothetical protein VM537_06580 [Anaerolineae bacterium]|nr:hypothetical protein [Anaerolineae bacterium]